MHSLELAPEHASHVASHASHVFGELPVFRKVCAGHVATHAPDDR